MRRRLRSISMTKDDTVSKSIAIGKKRTAPYYLPVVFLIVLLAAILIDLLNG